jgi:hypothetical protein
MKTALAGKPLLLSTSSSSRSWSGPVQWPVIRLCAANSESHVVFGAVVIVDEVRAGDCRHERDGTDEAAWSADRLRRVAQPSIRIGARCREAPAAPIGWGHRYTQMAEPQPGGYISCHSNSRLAIDVMLPCMVDVGKVMANSRSGERFVWRATHRSTGGAYCEFDLYLSGGAKAAAPHRHPNQEERLAICSGGPTAIRTGSTASPQLPAPSSAPSSSPMPGAPPVIITSCCTPGPRP